MQPPFRADHVGSLLRPPDLKAARAAKLPPDQLKEVEDRAIRNLGCLGAFAGQQQRGGGSAADENFIVVGVHAGAVQSRGKGQLRAVVERVSK